jgi:hypothetical protein
MAFLKVHLVETKYKGGYHSLGWWRKEGGKDELLIKVSVQSFS